MDRVIIIGSGAAGLSAAIQLAEENVPSLIIQEMPSWRAQSNMAEGGINAALDTMGQGDSPDLHEAETYKAGRFLACKEAVHRITHAAPGIVRTLYSWGMAFNINPDGTIQQRPFGGQTKKRTAFASASTGKQLVYTLSTRARQFEADHLIRRMTGYKFLKLITKGNKATGVLVCEKGTDHISYIPGSAVILASGGMNGLFGNATGSVLNTGHVTAAMLAEGLPLSNLEMIQYHPTTVKLHGKNMLITEAVRGEGGRLFVNQDGERYYFMEDKYPLGNLMPRDVVAREEWQWIKKGMQPHLSFDNIPVDVSRKKLTGVLEACHDFLNLDPLQTPIPVSPGIHYFMGGLHVDVNHRMEIRNLYAAGEAAAQYHGANRLGANSLLGAMFGGRVAAKSAMEDLSAITSSADLDLRKYDSTLSSENRNPGLSIPAARRKLNFILQKSLGIERNEKEMLAGLDELAAMEAETIPYYDEEAGLDENLAVPNWFTLSRAIFLSALNRKESRGAHSRTDYPGENEEYRKTTIARCEGGEIQISMTPIEGDTNADPHTN